MATNIYLSVEFSTGNLFQYSKEEKHGFEKHVNKNNKVTYRKYWKEGVYGVYRGTSVRKTDFGKDVSIHMIDANGDNVFINFPLLDQNKDIAAYAESFITILPAMQLNYVYRVFPYAMKREKSEYKNYGVSVRHADMHARTVREDHLLERLSYSYEKENGEEVVGDIPKIKWVKNYDNSMKKDCTERNTYLFNVLMANAEEKTQGTSNKVSSDIPPAPYTGTFGNGSTTSNIQESDNYEHESVEEDHEEEVSEAPRTENVQESQDKVGPKKSKEPTKEEKPSNKGGKVQLPF